MTTNRIRGAAFDHDAAAQTLAEAASCARLTRRYFTDHYLVEALPGELDFDTLVVFDDDLGHARLSRVVHTSNSDIALHRPSEFDRAI